MKVHQMMRLLLVLAVLSLGVFSAAAQDTEDLVTQVTCEDGTVLNDGLLFFFSTLPGDSLMVTAMGRDGFDPIIAVAYPPEEEGGALVAELCIDDEPVAAEMWVNLPTISTDPSASIAQLGFTNDIEEPTVVIFAVFNGAETGDVAVQIEGPSVDLAVDSEEADVIGVYTPAALAVSGASMTVYMISQLEDLDSYLEWIDEDGLVREDDSGLLFCDDAGSQYCYEEYVSLIDFSILLSDGNVLPGGTLDAMLNLVLPPDEDPATAEASRVAFRFTSSSQSSEGEYVVVFHIAPTVDAE